MLAKKTVDQDDFVTQKIEEFVKKAGENKKHGQER